MTFENDRDMIEAALATIGPTPAEHARVVRIRNTLALEEVEVSEAFSGELDTRPDLEALEAPRPMFGSDGTLPAL
jgi:hypothetical protein